jgi:exodeoxyribonuclease III
MKLISWNVNGLRACMGKGFGEFLKGSDADVVCVQETKMQPEQADFSFDGYTGYWNSAAKKGYSGTAAFTRIKPNGVSLDIAHGEHVGEGRAITLEFGGVYLVNVYVPNSQADLVRLGYRMGWEDAFREYVTGLDSKKPVIICGDMNVAHREIDLKNPKQNVSNPGFTPEEREKMTELLGAGFVDTFRALYPEKKDAYTWWSYRFRAREHDAGWRIDYFLVSKRLAPSVKDSIIYKEVMGSDHCPVGLEISI